MNILNILGDETQKKYISSCYDFLRDLNIFFTNNVVYKIMRIVDEAELYKIKDKARMFQEEICYMLEMLGELNKKYLLLSKKIDDFGNQTVKEKFFIKQITKIVKTINSFNSLYTEINDKLKSYKSFIVKQVKLADHIYRQDKKKKYKMEMEAKVKKNKEDLAEKFKGLNDKEFLLYLNMYNKSMAKLDAVNEKLTTPSFPEEEKHNMAIAAVFLGVELYVAEKQLGMLEEYYYKLMPADFNKASKKFKDTVLDSYKKINAFDAKVDAVSKVR